MCEIVGKAAAKFFRGDDGRLRVRISGYINGQWLLERDRNLHRYKFEKVTGLYPSGYANVPFHISMSDYLKLRSGDEGDEITFAVRQGDCFQCRGES